VIGSWAAAGLVVLAGSLAQAQDFQKFFFRLGDSPQPVQIQEADEPAAPIEVGDHWIGVLCQPAGEVVKSQLKLDHGLVVERVVPDSPAAKAGIEPHDILLSFGETKLAEVVDLVEAVKAAQDNETDLKFVHTGEEKSVKIVPAKRPEGDAELQPPLTPQEAFKNWIEESMPEGLEDVPLRLRRFRPGILLPETMKEKLELPDNLAISITRQGKEKAQITVTKDGKTYNATEDKLDELPEDVRPHVERLLRQGAGVELNFDALKWIPEDIAKKLPQIKKEWQLGPPPEIRVYPGRPDPQMLRTERRMREQLDQMRRSLDELQKQLDDLHGRADDEKKPDVGVEVEPQPEKPKD
jgi:hypothetical protein